MDAILNALVTNGIGGAMAIAVIWFLHRLTTKTIPDIIVTNQRDLVDARRDYKETLDKQQIYFQSSLIRIEDRWQKSVDAIVGRLESLDRHTKANQEHLATLREYIHAIEENRKQISGK